LAKFRMQLLILLSLVCVVLSSTPARFPVHHTPLITEKFVQRVNLLAKTWEAGFNEGSSIHGASRSQIQRLLGARKGGVKLPVKRVFEVKPEALPDNFDSRVNWPQCTTISTVRDQSACGSCFAFGAVEAMSDRICIHLKGTITSLSSGDAAFCCDACGDGCDGGYPSAVWQYWKDTGIVEEACWPYPFASCDHHLNGSTKPCPGNEYPSADCPNSCDKSWNGPAWSADRHHASSVYNIDGGETAIMQEIMQNGPVETAFTVYADFLSYKSGVYQYTFGDELGGHAVKIIGWGVTSNGVKYWIVANSWNADWGEKGFFRIIRGTDDCGF